jgi:hypothetical protein
MGYNVTKSNFKNTQVKIIPSTYWYIQVCTGNIIYIICYAVGIGQDHDNGVQPTPQALST